MPTLADAPLRKVTLNLYEADCLTLAAHYGRGWSSEIRAVINAHASLIRQSVPQPQPKRKTLGDLE